MYMFAWTRSCLCLLLPVAPGGSPCDRSLHDSSRVWPALSQHRVHARHEFAYKDILGALLIALPAPGAGARMVFRYHAGYSLWHRCGTRLWEPHIRENQAWEHTLWPGLLLVGPAGLEPATRGLWVWYFGVFPDISIYSLLLLV